MMSRTKFPITRRERFKLREKCKANNENEDSCSLYSRSETGIPPMVQAGGGQYYNGGGDAHVPPSPAAASSVFLPPNQRPDEMPDDVFDSMVPNGADIDPSRQSIGEISIPPSVPSEYQFPWPPKGPMRPIPEESFYSERSGYDYKYDASGCDIFWCLWAVITYLFDIGSDIFVAMIYLQHGHIWWFVMTLSFIVVPAVTMTIFSFVLYIRDWKVVGDKATPFRWASRILFLVLQLGPLLRIVDTLYYACKSRSVTKIEEKMHFFERMVDEDVDSMMLRLFEAFMEAAPQLVLQLYVLSGNGLNDGWTLVALQFMSLCSSLVTLAMTLVSFQKALRQSQGAKAKLTYCGMAGQFMWRLFTIGTRVVALAMFAHYFKWWVFIVCGVHYVVMFVWISQQRTNYCAMETPDGKVHHKKIFEFFFHVLAAFIHIFAFFNLLEGHTRLRALLFYGIVYVENCALILAWYIASSTTLYSEPEAHQAPVVGIVMGLFWAGIFFMLMYYKFCHPNNSSILSEHKSIKLCVPCNEMFLCSEYGDEEEEVKDIKIASPEEKQQMTGPPVARNQHNMSYDKPLSIRSSGPKRCVDPVPKTEVPANLNRSMSYREPTVYDSYAQLNTSKRSINPNPPNQPGHSIAYREPQTLDSLLNKSTAV